MALVIYARRLWRRLLHEIDKYTCESGRFAALVPVLPLPQQHDSVSHDGNCLDNNGFLWSWHRRSLERRLMRKIGSPRVIHPKRNLLICDVCGHYYEAHTVCGNCWKKVKEETKAMQEAIQNQLQLKPVEKEVVVFYSNDAFEKNQEGKTVVEIPRERPPWFSKNLLTKSNS